MATKTSEVSPRRQARALLERLRTERARLRAAPPLDHRYVLAGPAPYDPLIEIRTDAARLLARFMGELGDMYPRHEARVRATVKARTESWDAFLRDSGEADVAQATANAETGGLTSAIEVLRAVMTESVPESLEAIARELSERWMAHGRALAARLDRDKAASEARELEDRVREVRDAFDAAALEAEPGADTLQRLAKMMNAKVDPVPPEPPVPVEEPEVLDGRYQRVR